MDQEPILRYLLESLMQTSYPDNLPRMTALQSGTNEAQALARMEGMARGPAGAMRLMEVGPEGRRRIGAAIPQAGHNPVQEMDMARALLSELMMAIMGGKVRTGRWQSKRNH